MILRETDVATPHTADTCSRTHGYSLKFHVNGDAAVQVALNALESVELERGTLRQRYVFDHVVLVSPDDYARMHRLNVVASVQPAHALVGQYGDQADHWGDERTAHSWNFAAFPEQNIPLAIGTDWPVWPTPDALVNYWTSVNGTDGRALDRATAMAGYTEIGALAVGAEQELGRIAAGYHADFVILSDNPLTSDNVSDITVEETWVAGVPVYR